MSTQLTTPVGRIVWGNPLVGREKMKNGQKVLKDGKPVIEYSFGLAIPKADFGPIAAAMEAEAKAACPQGIPPSFAWKVKDGDTGVDKNGQPLNLKPGYPGHMVIALTTEFPIRVFQRNGNEFPQMTGGVKTGDYCRAQITIRGHGAQPGVVGAKAGLYMNPDMVEFLGYGEAITTQANPAEAFGQPVTLPPGASATPTASGPMPTAAPQAAPAPAPAPSAPTAPAAPHTTFPWGNG